MRRKLHKLVAFSAAASMLVTPFTSLAADTSGMTLIDSAADGVAGQKLNSSGTVEWDNSKAPEYVNVVLPTATTDPTDGELEDSPYNFMIDRDHMLPEFGREGDFDESSLYFKAVSEKAHLAISEEVGTIYEQYKEVAGDDQIAYLNQDITAAAEAETSITLKDLQPLVLARFNDFGAASPTATYDFYIWKPSDALTNENTDPSASNDGQGKFVRLGQADDNEGNESGLKYIEFVKENGEVAEPLTEDNNVLTGPDEDEIITEVRVRTDYNFVPEEKAENVAAAAGYDWFDGNLYYVTYREVDPEKAANQDPSLGLVYVKLDENEKIVDDDDDGEFTFSSLGLSQHTPAGVEHILYKLTSVTEDGTTKDVYVPVKTEPYVTGGTDANNPTVKHPAEITYVPDKKVYQNVSQEAKVINKSVSDVIVSLDFTAKTTTKIEMAEANVNKATLLERIQGKRSSSTADDVTTYTWQDEWDSAGKRDIPTLNFVEDFNVQYANPKAANIRLAITSGDYTEYVVNDIIEDPIENETTKVGVTYAGTAHVNMLIPGATVTMNKFQSVVNTGDKTGSHDYFQYIGPDARYAEGVFTLTGEVDESESLDADAAWDAYIKAMREADDTADDFQVVRPDFSMLFSFVIPDETGYTYEAKLDDNNEPTATIAVDEAGHEMYTDSKYYKYIVNKTYADSGKVAPIYRYYTSEATTSGIEKLASDSTKWADQAVSLISKEYTGNEKTALGEDESAASLELKEAAKKDHVTGLWVIDPAE